MITYSEFVKIRRLEQEDSRTLTKLTDETLDEMKDYIAINKKSLEVARNAKDQKKIDEISSQINNAISTLEQILLIRMKKLSNIAIMGLNTQVLQGNLLSKEIILFDKFREAVDEMKSKVMTEVSQVEPKEPEKPEETEDKQDKMVIKIIADVPQFIWKNNKSYGPFSFSNTVEIDREVAEILIKSGKAVGD
ncbi:hypothetical protein M1293_00510 [Candidatus Parvarchaeota archaeon]|nr:hypothetical protein [Candidatus Parvarchaeota archaeon]